MIQSIGFQQNIIIIYLFKSQIFDRYMK